MTQNKAILAVLAHPDDESFGMGGTLAYYARQGCDVYLACATRGEVGTVDAEHMAGFKSIAELREAELRCASAHLGLKEVFFLGYRDSGMPNSEDNKHPEAQINAPLEAVAARVVKIIRAIKPEVVLTFDPIGGYRHPDHIHIHNATVLAFEKAADAAFHPEAGAPFQPGRLYFHVFPRGFMRMVTRLMPLFGFNPRQFGRNKDIDMVALTEVQFPTHVRIDIRSVAEIKREAGACHASQGGGIVRPGVMGTVMRLLGQRENYMQAYPPVNGKFKIKRDLLA